MDYWAGIAKVWDMIKPTRFGVLLAGALFIILVLWVGKDLGYSPQEIWDRAALIAILAVFIFVLNNLRASSALKSFMSWAMTLIILYMAGSVAYRFSSFSSSISRTAYQRENIGAAVGNPAVMLTPPNIPMGASDNEKQLAAQNKFWEWVRDGVNWQAPAGDDDTKPDPSRGAIVIRSSASFDRNYQTIRGIVQLNSNIKIDDGIAFLRSTHDGRYVYRQMTCKADSTSDDNGATFALIDPNPTEDLLMIIRVHTKDGLPLNGNSTSYGINLKVNQ